MLVEGLVYRFGRVILRQSDKLCVYGGRATCLHSFPLVLSHCPLPIFLVYYELVGLLVICSTLTVFAIALLPGLCFSDM